MKFCKIALFVISSCLFLQCNSKDNNNKNQDLQITDSARFAMEYPLVGDDNLFVYRNANETADILANGRGVVFIGYKECPWCQLYAVFLHDVVRELEIEQIFYCDIREDRQNNTEGYQRIVGILDGYLQYDDEGRQRLYVPDLTIVSRGRIIIHDFETSLDTQGYNTPQEYWNDERVDALKERIRGGIDILKQIIRNTCDTC